MQSFCLPKEPRIYTIIHFFGSLKFGNSTTKGGKKTANPNIWTITNFLFSCLTTSHEFLDLSAVLYKKSQSVHLPIVMPNTSRRIVWRDFMVSSWEVHSKPCLSNFSLCSHNTTLKGLTCLDNRDLQVYAFHWTCGYMAGNSHNLEKPWHISHQDTLVYYRHSWAIC